MMIAWNNFDMFLDRDNKDVEWWSAVILLCVTFTYQGVQKMKVKY